MSLWGTRIATHATVRIAHSPEGLSAHVELDGNPPMYPGDRVQLAGPPVAIAIGGEVVERRAATLTRASWAGRLRTRAAAWFELSELYEVSFTPGRMR